MFRVLRYVLTPVLALAATPALAQNLVTNPGFEDGVVIDCDQGRVPAPWYLSTVTPDLYSFDCAQMRGLDPDINGNFSDIDAAQGGIRFMAGSETTTFVESFGQPLATPLAAGGCYRLSGYFTRSLRSHVKDPGQYTVYLSPTSLAADGIAVGTLGEVAEVGAWVPDSVTFQVPGDYTQATNLILVPEVLDAGVGTYIGTDDWELVSASCSVPVESESWGAVKGRY